MLRNYFKVALRYLLRYKEYTIINVLGLSVGIASCLLIMLYVRSEYSYDRFHSKAAHIYRVWQHERYQGHDFINTVTPIPAAQAIKASIPEVNASCRVYNFNTLVKTGNISFTENINMVDTSFFSIFDFKLLVGNSHKPFPTANAVLLTTDLAKKLFGNNQVIGKNLILQMGDDSLPFIVEGIVEPSPEASSIKFEMLISYDNAKYLFRERAFHSWTNIFNETYVLLKEGVNPASVEMKFPAMIKEQFGADYREGAFTAHLQPITDIHLNNSLLAGNLPISNPKYSYILSTVGLLILLLACINFISLSVGRSATRAMEVGVRKVLGAARQQLIRQFWGEAFLLTLISVFLGFIIAIALLSPFNQLTQKNLYFQIDWFFILFGSLLVAFVALISGIYPALILSGFNPVEVLKGNLKFGSRLGIFRHSLIVGQFVVAIVMIICTLVIGRQMKFLQEKDLGYNKDQVVIVSTNKKIADGFTLASLYRTELLKHPEVAAVTTSVFSFAETPWATLGYTDDQKNYRHFQFNVIDPFFIHALNIQMAAGRNFEESNTADKFGSIVVNEALVKEYGWDNAIGKKLPGPYDERIIGVTKDFNFESLHTKVKPLVLALSPDSIMRHSEDVSFENAPQPRLSVRMKAGSLTQNIAILKNAWTAVSPKQEFEFHFLDDSIAAQYQQEKRTDIIIKLASSLSIFIACIGLFGLATLAVVRRTKEIGIRKVLGASVGSLVGLLSKDFIRLVLIATLIAFPLSWWAMNDWLKDFAYRTPVSWWLFILAAFIALMIAMITLSFQSVRAALTNPVKSLKTE
jgi:putative ABC transport system permease protein